MYRAYKFMGVASALALAAAASPALAAGTQSGTSITNTVSVNYNVGGVAQTAKTASDTFTVDRKVNIVVAENGSTTTQVSPGQTSAVTSFTVTNSSNDTLDLLLTASQQTGGAGAHSNTDNFDVTNVKIYKDVNGDGLLDGGDTLVTYLDEVAPDTTVKVLVVADVPLSAVTGDVAAVTLQAQAAAGGAAGSQGAVLTQTTGANTAGVDTVFADAAGAATGDVARDGKHSAKDDYTVLAAALTATKTSTVISDPQNGSTNPKAIPGATIEYCIVVSNAAGSATATNVAISDNVPSQLTQTGAINIRGPVASSSNACTATNSGTGSIAGSTVSGTLPNLTAGQAAALVFQATVN